MNSSNILFFLSFYFLFSENFSTFAANYVHTPAKAGGVVCVQDRDICSRTEGLTDRLTRDYAMVRWIDGKDAI